ncbi:MAG TPA: PhzF family phenazine biosynthesis protein, partial [Actinomycetota bacterium]|nr:PhzF family phenazine biosynthesis protein [Actinomycetota bacterium]
FAGLGISEDPATGSAAAALGIYLADRVGEMNFEVAQGAEVGRPSRIKVTARPGSVQVAGRCELIFSGRLLALP